MQQEEETIKNLVETIHITTLPSSQTFKRLIMQLGDARKEVTHLKAEAMYDRVKMKELMDGYSHLRDSRKEVAHLKAKAMYDRVKMKELMDGYSHTLDLARFAARKAQLFHRQLKNLYRQNKDFQSQNRKLKGELQLFQDEMAQRNLHVLVEYAIEKEKPTTKESIAPVRKPTTVKGKKPIVPKGSRPSIRRSVRLMK
jgi:hypothetical protein